MGEAEEAAVGELVEDPEGEGAKVSGPGAAGADDRKVVRRAS